MLTAEQSARPDADALYRALFDIQYAMRLDALHARFWGRVKITFAIVSLVGGSAAFAAYFSNRPGMAAFAGLVLAVVAVLNQVLAPADRVARFNEFYRRFAELKSLVNDLPIKDLEHRLARLRAENLPVFETLRRAAYNDAMTELDLQGEPFALTGWQKVLVAFA